VIKKKTNRKPRGKEGWVGQRRVRGEAQACAGRHDTRHTRAWAFQNEQQTHPVRLSVAHGFRQSVPENNVRGAGCKPAASALDGRAMRGVAGRPRSQSGAEGNSECMLIGAQKTVRERHKKSKSKSGTNE
jgi:hypothetical protein